MKKFLLSIIKQLCILYGTVKYTDSKTCLYITYSVKCLMIVAIAAEVRLSRKSHSNTATGSTCRKWTQDKTACKMFPDSMRLMLMRIPFKDHSITRAHTQGCTHTTGMEQGEKV